MRKLKAKQKCAGATSIFGKNKPRYFKFKEGNDSPWIKIKIIDNWLLKERTHNFCLGVISLKQ